MGKEARTTVLLDDEVRQKLDEYVAAVTAVRYGPDGPPNPFVTEIFSLNRCCEFLPSLPLRFLWRP